MDYLLLKQPQYQPVPIEEQVVSLFAGTNGYLDKIAVRDIGRFEKLMLAAMRDKAGDILQEIRTEKQITDALKARLKAFLDDFSKSFT